MRQTGGPACQGGSHVSKPGPRAGLTTSWRSSVAGRAPASGYRRLRRPNRTAKITTTIYTTRRIYWWWRVTKWSPESSSAASPSGGRRTQTCSGRFTMNWNACLASTGRASHPRRVSIDGDGGGGRRRPESVAGVGAGVGEERHDSLDLGLHLHGRLLEEEEDVEAELVVVVVSPEKRCIAGGEVVAERVRV